jgi:H+/Cl- antiporter ClcA
MLNTEATEDKRAGYIRFIIIFVVLGLIIGLGPDMMQFLTGMDLNNIQTCDNIQQSQQNCMPTSLKNALLNAVFLARIVGALVAIAGGGIFALIYRLE